MTPLTYSPGKISALRHQCRLSEAHRESLAVYNDISTPMKQKKLALKQLADVSMPCWLESNLFIAGPGKVTIEKGVFANHNLTVITHANVTLCKSVFIGPNVVIAAASLITQGIESALPTDITVHQHAWIGANAVILSGVTIGEGAIVGAGAVVEQSVEPGAVVAGVPAVFKRWVKDS